MSALQITIPGWVPDSRLSLNGRRRGSWHQTWKLQQEAMNMVIPAIWATDWHPKSGTIVRTMTMHKARVTIELIFPQKRRRDPDGLAGRAKPILDALVSQCVIEDDSTEHIELTLKATVQPGVTETRICVEEVTG